MGPELIAWLTVFAALVASAAFVTTAVLGILTYRKARSSHQLLNGMRIDGNRLAVKIAYTQGYIDGQNQAPEKSGSEVFNELFSRDT